MQEISWQNLKIDDIRGCLIFLDIDGTIVTDGNEKIDDSIFQKIAILNLNNKVFLCSNKNHCATRNSNISKITGITFLDIPHKKPSKKILAYIEKFRELPMVVIGDKFLIDGFFAWRIGAKFIKIKRLVSVKDDFIIKIIYFVDDVFFGVNNIFKICRF